MKNRALQFTDLVMVIVILWGLLAAIPATYWYNAEQIFIENSNVHEPPRMTVRSQVRRSALIEYQVTLRKVGAEKLTCEATGGPFTYRKRLTELQDVNWTWWTGNEASCWPLPTGLPPGDYISETCWTIVQPFWGLVPPKTTCMFSNIFTITAISPEQAEEAISATQSLKQQVESLQEELKQVEQQTKELTNDVETTNEDK